MNLYCLIVENLNPNECKAIVEAVQNLCRKTVKYITKK